MLREITFRALRAPGCRQLRRMCSNGRSDRKGCLIIRCGMGARWSITTKRGVVAGFVVLAIVLLWRAGDIVQPFLVFLIATFLLLRDAPRLYEFVRRNLPSRQRREIVQVLGETNVMLGRYIRGQFLLVVLMSTVTTIALTLLGVPYSVLLGVLTGLLETIPFVGPITAGALACLVAPGHPNPFGWAQLIYVGVVATMYTILRHAEDYLVIPTVIGRAVRLHPAIVIFSLLTGGAVFGLIGIVLAVPFAATLRLGLIYVGAKLRDEDPFPRLEVEVAEAAGTPGEAIETTRAPGRARP